MKHKSSIIVSIFVLSLLLLPNMASATQLGERLKGKILLQVESHGEAWYVNPANTEKYYMGRPADAFALMRQLGVGINNANLKKIPVADTNLSGTDTDQDGLSDTIESALQTDMNKADTDADGISDKTEILNQAGDKSFTEKQKGKIFLQVESHGEAWYVNPADGKRYFLGRPADAFSVMRNLGLGIKNSDLEQIAQNASNAAGDNSNNNTTVDSDNTESDNQTNNNTNNTDDYTNFLNNLLNNNTNNDTTNDTSAEDTTDTSEDTTIDTDTTPPPPPAPVYKTATKLTTITLHRTIDGYYNTYSNTGVRDQDLKEVAPNSHELTLYGDRAYEFDQGKVKWDVSERAEYGDMVKCKYIDTTEGDAEDLIANLDVGYDTNDGRDDDGNIVHMSVYDLRLRYKNIGMSGKAELDIVGSLIIPVTVTNTVNVLSSHTICSNATSSETATSTQVTPVKFPLTWLNPTLTSNQSGNLTAYETSNDLDTSNITSTTAPAEFGLLPFVGKITVDNMHTPWTVTWNLEFPN